LRNAATPREWQKVQGDLPVPGDLIWIRRRQWRVSNTHVGDGLARVDVDGWLPPESRSFLLPSDHWTRDVPRRVRRASARRALAWLAACTARAHPAAVPASIVSSSAGLLAYQLEPALAMLAGRRRILIADDVGLGKTIQAALIIAEALQRQADARVLVLAPASLLAQWRDELEQRFGVSAQTADAGAFMRLRAERSFLANPWEGPGVWIASPDYLKQAHVMEAMPPVPFDLLVIDEAHGMAGNSNRHSAADDLARRARQVVLLTATPHDGSDVRFRRLVALGATGSDADALTVFRRVREMPARNVRRLDVSPGEGLARILAAIESFTRAGRSGASADGLLLLSGVFRKRALSSLAALVVSLTRRLEFLSNAMTTEPDEAWTQPGLAFTDAEGSGDDDVLTADEQFALRGSTGLSAARERAWLQRLIGIATSTSMRQVCDPKIARLVPLLARTSEPVVIFTEYRDSLTAIAMQVDGVRRVAVLHGGLSGAEQRGALASFLHGRSDALLATDVASQGLNLQHRSRWVVHFDLPWTPMRLEQRVGRVDRIGQTRRVHVTFIGLRHPAERALRRRLVVRRSAVEAAPLPSCTRWTRAGDGLAHWFARQRALASHWRGPDPSAVLRARVRAGVLRQFGLDDRLAWTLVELPLIANTGDVIERRLAWLVGYGGDVDTGVEIPTSLIRRARALTARARRRCAALQAAQANDFPVKPHQPGLFAPRGLPGDRFGSGIEPVRSSTAQDITIHVGRPQPLLVLERR
jgi:superfamily II DNA or RNA helicase